YPNMQRFGLRVNERGGARLGQIVCSEQCRVESLEGGAPQWPRPMVDLGTKHSARGRRIKEVTFDQEEIERPRGGVAERSAMPPLGFEASGGAPRRPPPRRVTDDAVTFVHRHRRPAIRQ